MNIRKKPKYISLKQAARISGYSSDYIGYLIRTGKISGKPTYTNIVWQTTVEEVLNYKNREARTKKRKLTLKDKILKKFFRNRQSLIQEINLLKLFIRNFRFIIPLLIILILSFSLLIGFAFSTKFNKSDNREIKREETSQDEQRLNY
jgi:hypothetical protein